MDGYACGVREADESRGTEEVRRQENKSVGTMHADQRDRYEKRTVGN